MPGPHAPQRVAGIDDDGREAHDRVVARRAVRLRQLRDRFQFPAAGSPRGIGSVGRVSFSVVRPARATARINVAYGTGHRPTSPRRHRRRSYGAAPGAASIVTAPDSRAAVADSSRQRFSCTRPNPGQ